MKNPLTRAAAIAVLAGLNAVLLSACAVTGGGYGYSTEASIGLDYYDPWFGDEGGWGPGYRVGPPRRPGPRPGAGPGHPPPRAYRPAPGGRPMPSIPSRPHPGSGAHRPGR